MFGRKKETYEKGYEKFEDEALNLANDPEKTDNLLKRAWHKADLQKGSLTEVWDKLALLLELVKQWSKGDYRDISKKTIVMVLAAILYFVTPIDMIPDFLVGLGIFDDAAVIGFTVKQISGELDRFKLWKEKESINLE